MRIIKTFISVFVCAVIGYYRGELPFYSMIAAILCMQGDLNRSFVIALDRTIGTFIGGGFGLVMLLFVDRFNITPLTPLYYLLVSLCIIPLIYLAILIKQHPAIYISCVVFLSITVSHITDELPILFVWHRVLDTLIGIAVSLLINFILPYRKKDSN